MLRWIASVIGSGSNCGSGFLNRFRNTEKMGLYVYKFGGTSVGTAERIRAVAGKVLAARERGDDIVVVVSAMSGETNRLVALAQEMQEEPEPREMDVLLSTGEQVTIALLCMALRDKGMLAVSYTGGHRPVWRFHRDHGQPPDCSETVRQGWSG